MEVAKWDVLEKGSGVGSRTHEPLFWLLYSLFLQL